MFFPSCQTIPLAVIYRARGSLILRKHRDTCAFFIIVFPASPVRQRKGEPWKVIGHNQREVYREPEATGGLQGGGE